MAAIRADQGRWDEALGLADPFLLETDGGLPHYLEPVGRIVRASIRLARGDLAGASADSARGAEVARPANDAQVVAPALAAHAKVLLANGKHAEADALAGEVLGLGPTLIPALAAAFATGIIEFAHLLRALGRESELLEPLDRAPQVPWVSATRAVASADWERAVAVLAEIECRPAEAYTHLRAAEELVGTGRAAEAGVHVNAALAFYRAVRATYFVDKLEAMAARPRDHDASAAGNHASSG